MTLSIAAWNVNSILARLPTALAVLKELDADVVCLQELKCEDHRFPRMEIEDLGYNVQAVESGAAAIEVLLSAAGQSVDLVFSDVVMPGGVSGYDLARWIATHRPGIKVLLTSGYPDEVAKTQTGAFRAVKLLRKPYNRIELAQTLREVLDH